MVQIGTWVYGAAKETCTKNYERHYASIIDRTRYESDPTREIISRVSYDWRTYGYCCSGICFTINETKVKLIFVLSKKGTS